VLFRSAAFHRERIEEALRGPQSGAVLVADLAQGLAVVDAYGAEHLEIQTAEADEVAARVTNAGAVFVGPHSPVSLGDYAAGSNHVLPTGGTSRFTGGLGVQTFLRGIHVVRYDRDALAGPARRRPRSPAPRGCPPTAPRSTCASRAELSRRRPCGRRLSPSRRRPSGSP